MENAVPKFAVGARVFAKMKGWPAWPAVVDGVRTSQSYNFNYDVFYYGTNQVGTCREDDLKPYAENRETLGKKKNYKGFNEAVKRMDCELDSENVSNNQPTTASFEFDPSEKEYVFEGGRGRPRSKSHSRSRSPSTSRSEPTVKRPRGRPRSASSSRSEPIVKRQRGRPRSASSSRSEPTIKRPRGRPRSASSSRSEPIVKRQRGRPRSVSQPRSEFDDDQDDPTFKPYQSKSRSRSTSRSSKKCRVSQRSLSLSSGKSDGCVKPNLKELQCIVNPDKESPSAAAEAFKFLKTESVLNDAIFGIQGSLTIHKANLEAARKHIDTFFILDLNPLMLKKHPDVVDIFENLQWYSGNVENWNMTESARKAFNHEVEVIKAKAKLINDRIKGLFDVPKGKDFYKFFEEEVNKFKRATEGISQETIWNMTKDPTLI